MLIYSWHKTKLLVSLLNEEELSVGKVTCINSTTDFTNE